MCKVQGFRVKLLHALALNKFPETLNPEATQLGVFWEHTLAEGCWGVGF